MTSAGNDIVALNLIDKERTIQPAFYSKFIITTETLLRQDLGISFENFVWLLWSVKESAYKYLKRGDGDLVFSPSKLIVQELSVSSGIDNLQADQPIDTYYTGTVSNGSFTLKFKSAVNAHFIATVIIEDDVYWGIHTVTDGDYHTQSNAVREFAVTRLNHNIIADKLWIDKHPSGYPFVLNGSHPLDISISFAHHGCYVSYAFRLHK